MSIVQRENGPMAETERHSRESVFIGTCATWVETPSVGESRFSPLNRFQI